MHQFLNKWKFPKYKIDTQPNTEDIPEDYTDDCNKGPSDVLVPTRRVAKRPPSVASASSSGINIARRKRRGLHSLIQLECTTHLDLDEKIAQTCPKLLHHFWADDGLYGKPYDSLWLADDATTTATTMVTPDELNRHFRACEDIYHLKRVADLLFCFELYGKAFALYVMLLKQLKAGINSPDWMRTWVKIACARSAANPAQRELAEHLVLQEMGLLQDGPGRQGIEALFSVLQESDDCQRMVLQLSSTTLEQDEEEIGTCPKVSTVHLLTLATAIANHGADWVSKKSLIGTITLLTKKSEKPPSGPVGDEAQIARHSRIRSCIQWCQQQLDETLEYTLSLLCHWARFVDQDIGAKPQAWLFGLMWERCQSAKASKSSPPWAARLESSMSLSVAEILNIVIMMMCDQDRPGEQEAGVDVLSNFRSLHKRATHLCTELDDDSLTTCFAIHAEVFWTRRNPASQSRPEIRRIADPALYFLQNEAATDHHLPPSRFIDILQRDCVSIFGGISEFSPPPALEHSLASTLHSSDTSMLRQFQEIRDRTKKSYDRASHTHSNRRSITSLADTFDSSMDLSPRSAGRDIDLAGLCSRF